MGIDDKTMLRLLKLGVMDFAAMDISKMAGDDPRFEACDLAGLTLDPDKARAACNAYRDVIDRQMQKNWNAKLLAFGGNPPQVFWCRDVIGGLDGLKGKKIRVFNNTMRDFLAGVGAHRGQHGLRRSRAGAQQRRRRLRRHRQPVGQHGGLARGDQVDLPDVARLEHQRAGGQPRQLEAARSQDAGLPAGPVQGLRGQDVGDVKTTTGEAENCNTGKQPCTMGKLAKIDHRAGEAGGGRDAQEAGRGRGAGRLGQALRRRMRQGVERDRRQGAGAEGADAVAADTRFGEVSQIWVAQ